jgi:hypothetical protein
VADLKRWAKKMTEGEDHSGELKFTEESLSYRSAAGSWSVNISDVRLIGEYTTANGPYIDDYFLVFVTALEGGWHEASFYARGRDELLAALSKKLGAPIETGLSNSAHFKTRIIWPEEWRGQNMLEVVPSEQKEGLWNRVWALKMPDEVVPSKAMRDIFSK